MKYEKERCELIECARAMEHYGLVMLSGGNVSLRMKDGTFLVTPSAMAYDSMIPEACKWKGGNNRREKKADK